MARQPGARVTASEAEAVLITGLFGTGKSSVAIEIADIPSPRTDTESATRGSCRPRSCGEAALSAALARGPLVGASRVECPRTLVEGSEGVLEIEGRDLAAEDNAGHAREAVVQPCPESGVDDLMTEVAWPVEVPHRV
jgi:hypothetical protein